MVWQSVPGGGRRHIFIRQRINCFKLTSACSLVWIENRGWDDKTLVDGGPVAICSSCLRRVHTLRLRIGFRIRVQLKEAA